MSQHLDQLPQSTYLSQIEGTYGSGAANWGSPMNMQDWLEQMKSIQKVAMANDPYAPVCPTSQPEPGFEDQISSPKAPYSLVGSPSLNQLGSVGGSSLQDILGNQGLSLLELARLGRVTSLTDKN